jgi:ribosomal protein S18 acetylase RimI-like enzyme
MSASVTVTSPRPDEQAEAFRLIFQHLPETEREPRVVNACKLLERGELEADGLFVVRGERSLRGAIVCTTAPGAGGLIWPPQSTTGEPPAVEDELIRRACDWLRRRGAKLAQTLLPPDEFPIGASLLRNGFAHVTTLWYMRHTLELSAVLLSKGEQLTYRPYPRASDLFHETLLRTYDGTADCPEISGVRTIEEVIAGHRAQGDHDPQRWWLALRADQPVGVLLLTRMTDWEGWDVSYVGVVPEARRQGVGAELMRKALLEAKSAGAGQMTLSVDARNKAAWELYRRLEFEPFEQREVLLAIWKREVDERNPATPGGV